MSTNRNVGSGSSGSRTEFTRADAKSVGVAVLGWTVDMFDLMVILHVARHVSEAFFPSENPMVGLTFTYASFAVSLVVRPLGGFILGSVADRAGRRRAMVIGVMGAGTATAMMGLLPGVAVLGVVAPILFIVLRVVQGIFVGGIAASTHTLATESVPERFRGMTAGLIKGGGASLAVVIINVMVIALTETIGAEAFADWGWRVLFVAALGGSILNYLVVRTTEESPLWIERRAQVEQERARAGAATVKTPEPGKILFSKPWRSLMLSSAAIVLLASAPYYLTTGILPTVYKQVFEFSQEQTSSFVIVNVIGSALVAVLCGHLSQHVGRRKVFLGAGIACLILIPGVYTLLLITDLGPGATLALSAIMVMASGAISAPLIIFLNERFPTELRSTATAVCWNIGYGLSGMVPTLVTALSSDPSDMIPTLIGLSLAGGAVFMILVVRSSETRGALERQHTTESAPTSTDYSKDAS